MPKIDKTVVKKFTGPLYWVRAWEHNYDDGEYGKQYVCSLEMTDEQYKEVRATGSRLGRKDETNLVNFRRKAEAYREEWGGPPKVYIKGDDGKLKVFEDAIGNGSMGEVTVTFFPYKAFGGGVGSRLEKIVVTDLIEYNPEDKDSEFDPYDDELEDF